MQEMQEILEMQEMQGMQKIFRKIMQRLKTMQVCLILKPVQLRRQKARSLLQRRRRSSKRQRPVLRVLKILRHLKQ